jgi:predicted esterase
VRTLVAVALVLLATTALCAQDRVEPESGLVYQVVPPTGWDGAQPVDVLVTLHGSGGEKDLFRRSLHVAVPGVRRFACVYVQSPDAQGWPQRAVPGVAAIASAVRAELPGQGLFLLGFSAGGSMSTACMFERPDLFEGAVIACAIAWRQPPVDPRVAARHLYWAVNADDETFGGLAAIENLRGWLKDRGYDEARYRIDLHEEPGLGHRINPDAVQRGLDWLRERAFALEPATDDDRARLAQVPERIAAKDAAGLRALADPIVTSRRGEARALLLTALAELPRHRDPELSRAGIDLLGRLGLTDGAAPLAGAISKLQRDPERQVAAIRALGGIVSPESCRALLTVVRRRDGDLAPQVAAAEALARVGGRAEVRTLINELNEVEKEKRPALAAAIDRALHEITGHELGGGRVWRAWWEQVGRRE